MTNDTNQNLQRTQAQNRSGHKWFTEIATTLNDAGLEQQKVLSQVTYSIPNTPESVKGIFRSFAKSMFNKESTTELTTKEWTEISDLITRELGEKLGIDIPSYPSEESLIMNQRIRGL